MTTDDPSPAWVPDACTLPTTERPPRRAEFDDLFRSAIAVERITERHARFLLTGSADRAEQVRDLAARETECCSFFTFTVTAQPPAEVVCDIEVPAGYVDVLAALVDRAAGVRAGG
jgi:hypothetical protein